MTRAEKKAAKILDARIDNAFRTHSNGVQIPMMKLGAVLKEAKLAVAYGADVDDAMKTAIEKHKVA